MTPPAPVPAPAPSPDQPGSMRLVLALGIAGMASGFILVGVFTFTQPMIQANRAERLMRAIYRVFPGAESVTPLTLEEGDRLVPREGATPDELPEGRTIYECRDASGRVVGYAIPAEGSGFQDTIRMIYGFDPHRRCIVGMQVLESRETPGLGDKIIDDENFHENFAALAVDPEIVTVKPGEKTSANEIEVISGATISSVAVAETLDASVKRWIGILEAARPGAPDANANADTTPTNAPTDTGRKEAASDATAD